MAIQFTDFSSKPLLESPWKNALEDVLKGYQMSQEPAKMKQEAIQRQLANQLAKYKVDEEPQRFKTEQAYKEALMNKAKNALSGDNYKPSADIANQLFIDKLRQSNPEEADRLQKLMNIRAEHTEAVTGRSKDITAGAAYDKLPINEKKRQVGLMTAMGVDPLEAVKMLRSGTSPSEYAEKNKIDISQVSPIYPLGEENVKQLQRRRGFVNELKNLESKVSEPLSRYPSKIRGYSLEQIADSLDIKDPKAMAEVLAARALSPEITALRLKSQGANVGIEAIRELQEKSLYNMNIIEGLVDSKTYLLTQQLMTKWLEEAADAYDTTMSDYGRLKGKSAHAGKTYNLATRSWE